MKEEIRSGGLKRKRRKTFELEMCIPSLGKLYGLERSSQTGIDHSAADGSPDKRSVEVLALRVRRVNNRVILFEVEQVFSTEIDGELRGEGICYLCIQENERGGVVISPEFNGILESGGDSFFAEPLGGKVDQEFSF